jgi:predicted nucleic acid-binding protein
MARLYLDTAPFVYHVERTMPFAPAVDARLAAADIVLVSSELTRLECLVLPLRNGDTARVGDFDMFFSARLDELVEFTGAVFRRAAEIRASGNFKTPDTLHLAAAIEGGCTAFLTNDAQLTRFAGLAVEVV